MKRLPHARFGLWSPIRKFISDRNLGGLPRHKRKRSLHIETLEERAMMAVDTSWNSTAGVLTLTITDGTPVIVGSILPSGESTALVSVNSSTQLPKSDGIGFTVAANLVKQIIFNGSSSNDQIDLSAVSGSVFTQLANSSLPFIASISGGSGNDTIVGTFGNDSIVGGLGNDSISSLDGNDTVTGGFGSDWVSLGAGNDKYLGTLDDTLNGADGNDTIDGGLGDDTIQNDSGDDQILLGDGKDQCLCINRDSSADGAEGEGNDTIYGGAGNDSVDGGEGDDYLIGESGDDTLEGGWGSQDHPGSDIYFGGTGSDSIVGKTGAEIIVGGDDGDHLESDGSEGSLVIGGNGSDVITGGSGADILIDGPTFYDSDLTATGLKQILNEWHDWSAVWKTANHVVYADRIAHITGTKIDLGMKNGTYFLPITGLINDQSSDVLKGGGGVDWFLGGFSDTSILSLSASTPAIENGEWIDDNSGVPTPIQDSITVLLNVSSPATSIDIQVSTLLANDGLGTGSNVHIVRDSIQVNTPGAQVTANPSDTGQFPTSLTISWGTLDPSTQIKFSYQLQSSKGLSASTATVTVSQVAPVTTSLVGDFNGDGLSDTVAFNPTPGVGTAVVTLNGNLTGTEWATIPTDRYWLNPIVADFTGDGKDDIIARDGLDGSWHIWRSVGTSFQDQDWAPWDLYGILSNPILGDYNGDGRDDLFYFNFSTYDLVVATSTGTGFDIQRWSTLYAILKPFYLDSPIPEGDVTFRVGDFDGDGKSDVLISQVSGLWSFVLSEGYRFTDPTPPQVFAGWSAAYLGNFKGDGTDQLLVWDTLPAGGGAAHWELVRFDGDHLTIDSNWGTLYGGTTNFKVQDVNFDGRDDLVRRSSNGTWTLLLAGPSGLSEANSNYWSPLLEESSWNSPVGRLFDQINPIQLSLAHDTLDSPTDFITDDPTINGKIYSPFGAQNLTIEIDTNQDGLPELSGEPILHADGTFTYQASDLAFGESHSIRARVVHHDPASGSTTSSHWESITFRLNHPPEIASLPDCSLVILPLPDWSSSKTNPTVIAATLANGERLVQTIHPGLIDSFDVLFITRGSWPNEAGVGYGGEFRASKIRNSINQALIEAGYTNNVIMNLPYEGLESLLYTLTGVFTSGNPLIDGIDHANSGYFSVPLGYPVPGIIRENAHHLVVFSDDGGSYSQSVSSPTFETISDLVRLNANDPLDDWYIVNLVPDFIGKFSESSRNTNSVGVSSDGSFYTFTPSGTPYAFSEAELASNPFLPQNPVGSSIPTSFPYQLYQSISSGQWAIDGVPSSLAAAAIVDSLTKQMAERGFTNVSSTDSEIVTSIATNSNDADNFDVTFTGNGQSVSGSIIFESANGLSRSTPFVINAAYEYQLNISDPENDQLRYDASVLTGPVGGGISSPNIISIVDGKLIFRPTVVGAYTLSLKVSDKYGASSSQVWTVRVSNSPQADCLWLTEDDRLVTTNATESLDGNREIIVQSTAQKSFAQNPFLKVTLSNAYFDSTEPDSMREAIELSIVDDQGKSVSESIGIGSDAFFNLSSGLPYQAANGVYVLKNTYGQYEVYLPVSGLDATKVYHLVAKLISNQHPSESEPGKSHVQVYAELVPTKDSAAILSSQQSYQTASFATQGHLESSRLRDVTGNFTSTYGATSFNLTTNVLSTTISLASKGLLTVPTDNERVLIAIDDISDPSIHLANVSGYLADGTPYIEITKAAFANGKTTILQGDTIGGIRLDFVNPTQEHFTYSLKVLGMPNQAPYFDSSTGNDALFVGASGTVPYQRQIHATDPEGDVVSYSLLAHPTGMLIDSGTGLITWAPPAGTSGSYSIVVSATDSNGNSAAPLAYVLKVTSVPNRPPVFIQLPSSEAYFGTPYVSTFSAIDPDGDTLYLNAILHGLNGSVSTGQNGNATISFTPQFSDIGKVFSVTLTATDTMDNTGGSISQTFQIRINPAIDNKPPIVLNDPSLSAVIPNTPSDSLDEVTPTKIDVTLGNGQTFTQEVTVVSGVNAYARVVIVVDSTVSFEHDKYQFAADLVTRLDSTLRGKGIGTTAAPNLFSLVSFPLSSLNTTYVYNFAQSAFIDLTSPDLTENSSRRVFAQADEFSSVANSLSEIQVNGNQTDYDAIRRILTNYRSSGLFPTDSSNGIILIDDQYPIDNNGADEKTDIISMLQGNSSTQVDDVSFTVIQKIDISGRPAGSNAAQNIPVAYLSGSWAITPTSTTVSATEDATPSLLVFDLPNLAAMGASTYRVTLRGALGMPEATDPGNVFIVFDYQDRDNYKIAGYRKTSKDNNDGDIAVGEVKNGVVTWISPATGMGRWDAYLTRPFEFSITGNMNGEFYVNSGGPNIPDNAVDLGVIAVSKYKSLYDGGNPYVWGGKIGIVTFGSPASFDFFRVEASGPAGVIAEYNINFKTGELESIGGARESDALWIDGNGIPYLPNGSGGYVPGTSGQVDYTQQFGYADVKRDYGDITLSTGNTFWSYNLLHGNAVLSDLFASRYADQILVNRRVDLISESSVVTDIVRDSVNPNKFSVTFAGDGVPRNGFNLKFVDYEGQEVAVIPVVVRGATYTYDIDAVDPEGSTLTYTLLDHPTGAVLSGSHLSWALGSGVLPGDYEFGVKITDAGGASTVKNWSVKVAPYVLNNDPVFITTELSVATVSRYYSYQVIAHDPDQDKTRYYLRPLEGEILPSWLSIDAATGRLQGTPTSNDIGNSTFQIVAIDGRGGSVVREFSLLVQKYVSPNLRPVFGAGHDSEVIAGDLLVRPIEAYDPNGDPLSFSLLSAPDGVILDATRGIVYWQTTAGDLGRKATVIVQAKDGAGLTATSSFEVEVIDGNEPPYISPVLASDPDLHGTPPVAMFVGRVSAADPNGDSLLISIDTVAGAAGFDVDELGNVWYYGQSTENVHPDFTITINDGWGDPVSQHFHLDAFPIRINAPTDPSLTVGQAGNIPLTISDLDGTVTNVSLDAISAERGITAVNNNGDWSLQWTPQLRGVYQVLVKAYDSRGISAALMLTIRVTAPLLTDDYAPEFDSSVQPKSPAFVGKEYTYSPSTKDADGDQIVYSLNDEMTQVGMTINPSTGKISWTPKQSGQFEVQIYANDQRGKVARQSFDLLVADQPVVAATAPTLSPNLANSPITQGYSDVAYAFAPIYVDSSNKPVDVAVTVIGPQGIHWDNATKSVVWTQPQVGSFQITLSASNSSGLTSTTQYKLEVSANSPIAVPDILSAPSQFAVVGQLYTYTIQVDPNTPATSYALAPGAPSWLSLTGNVLSGTPTFVSSQPQMVDVTAFNSAGIGMYRRFGITVLAQNASPTVESSSISVNQQLGSSFTYSAYPQFRDTDSSNGDYLTYHLEPATTSGTLPTGLSIDRNGQVSWDSGLPTTEQDIAFKVAAVDRTGATASFLLTVHFRTDVTPPKVSAWTYTSAKYSGDEVAIGISTSDPSGINWIKIYQSLNGGAPEEVHVPVSANGYAFVALPNVTSAGIVQYWVIATDNKNNSSAIPSQKITINVSPKPSNPPTVKIYTPYTDKPVNEPTEVFGTVADSDGTVNYTVSLVSLNGSNPQTISLGSYSGASITNNVLQIGTTSSHTPLTIDPRTLANGSYRLVITATDSADNHYKTSDERIFSVDNDGIYGNLSLSFTDLTVATNVLPIQIVRTYDIHNANQFGEFGYGWNLSFLQQVLQVDQSTLGDHYFGTYAAFRQGTRLTFTLPDGTKQTFRFAPEQVDDETYQINFDAENGTTGYLTVSNPDVSLTPGIVTGDFDGTTGDQTSPYNPADPLFSAGDFPSYTLVNNGITYTIDASTGRLTSISTTSGDSLTISSDSIKTSDGVEVQIKWEALANGSKRISQVIDPQGNAIKYGYDATGNLVSVTNRANEKVKYEYGGANAPAHGLAKITDPSGVVAIQASYTSSGTINVTSGGSSVTYDYSGSIGSDRVEKTIQPQSSGGSLLTQLTRRDPAGNIVRQVQVNDATGVRAGRIYTITLFEYDEQGRIYRQSRPIGMTHSQMPSGLSGDDYAPLKVDIDPASIVWAQTNLHDQEGHVVQVTDASGHAIKYAEFDQYGHPKFTIDLTTGAVNIADYNDQGNLTYSEDALGDATRYTYDLAGKLLQKTEKRKSNGEWVTLSTNTYTSDGQITSTTDSRGQTQFYLYDEANRPIVQFYLSMDESTNTQMLVADQTIYDSEDRAITSKHYVVDGSQLTAANALTKVHVDNNILKIDSTSLTPKYSTETHYTNGRVDYTIDQYGNKNYSLYDDQGRVVQSYYLAKNETGAATWVVTRTYYNNLGQVEFQTDPFTLTFNQNATLSGALASTASGGVHGTFTVYDKLGRVTSTQRRTNVTATLQSYSITLDDGSSSSYYKSSASYVGDGSYGIISTNDTTYRADGLVNTTQTSYSSFEEDDGPLVTYGYDTFGRQKWVNTFVYVNGTDDINQTTYTIYDDAGRVAETIDASNQRTWYEYNLLGQQTAIVTESVTDPDATDSARSTVYLRTETKYDAFGRRSEVHTGITMTDPLDLSTISRSRALITKYGYDNDGKLTQVTLPEVPTFDVNTFTTGSGVPVYQYGYDARGNQTSLIDPMGRQTQFKYDAEGRQVTRTLPIGVTTSDPNDFVEKTTYDVFGNVVLTVDLDGRVTKYFYDYATPAGAPSAGTQGLSGRLVQKWYWASESDLNANSNTPFEKELFTYDAFGQTTKVQKLNSTGNPIQTLQNTYDAQGHMTKTVTTDGSQASTTINYDYYKASGRLARVYTGDANGSIRSSSSQDGKGVTETAYKYDAFGRLSTVYAVERNDEGRPFNENTTTVNGYSFGTIDKTQYGYDNNGNLDWEILPDGVTVDYAYDSLNRLTSVNSFIDGNGNHRTDSGERLISTEVYTTDILGHRTHALDTFYNDNGTILRQESFDWEYDDAGKLVDEVYSKVVGDTHSYHDHFYYDLVGNRVGYAHDDKASTLEEVDSGDFYFYDDNDRLSGNLAFEIENGDIQPIKTTTYEYGTLNSSGVLIHDGTSLARKTEWQGVYVEGSSNTKLSSTEYRYNLQGQMSEVKIDSNANGSPNSTITYTYDANGNRISQTEVDNDTTKTTTTTYIVDIMNPTGYSQVIEQKQVVDDVDTANDISTRTSFTIGLDIITQQSATRANTVTGFDNWNQGTLYTLLYDGHGSTRGLLIDSGSTTTIAADQQFTYAAFGELVARYDLNGIFRNVSPATSLLYSGEQSDLVTGMQYLRARYFNLSTARFTAMDQIRGINSDPLSLHRYFYTKESPIGLSDPSGNMSMSALAPPISALAPLYGHIAGLAAAADASLDPSLSYPNIVEYYGVGYVFGYVAGEAINQSLSNPGRGALVLLGAATYLGASASIDSFSRGLNGQGAYRALGVFAGMSILAQGRVGQFAAYARSFAGSLGETTGAILASIGLKSPPRISPAVALGLANGGNPGPEPLGLSMFAKMTESFGYWDWAKVGLSQGSTAPGPAYEATLVEALENASWIHFSLKGISRPTVSADAGARFGFNLNNLTNAELNMVRSRFLNKTTFYDAEGNVTPSPF